MPLILTSTDAVTINGAPDKNILKVLRDAAHAGYTVGVISNNVKPSWFADVLTSKHRIQFVQSQGRQSGRFVELVKDKFGIDAHDILVLATTDIDLQMGKNGGAVLLGAGWSQSQQIKQLGLAVADLQELKLLLELVPQWPGQWWYSAQARDYSIRAMADLSTMYKGATQEQFGRKVTSTVKNGGARLGALLAVTSRSLLMDGFASTEKTMWGVYPSSNSNNNDDETLSDFTHRLRTTITRDRFCKRGEPLFIRHVPSSKRSAGGAANREDPTEQLMTMNVNPHYKGKVAGRHVVVIDDCTTYGTSFGVASALLHAAEASSVTCLALGKFGNQTREYRITITGDPFAPLSQSDFIIDSLTGLSGNNDPNVQSSLRTLIL